MTAEGRARSRLQPQDLQVGGGQVGGVLPDGRQAPAACEHSRHGQGQDCEQAVAHTPPITRVSHILKNLGQGLARQDGHGGI